MTRVAIALAALVTAASTATGVQESVVPTVLVTINGRSCVVSRPAVPAGRVRFRVVNRAKRVATFSYSKRTIRVPARTSRVSTLMLGAGRVKYRCRVGSRTVGRGILVVRSPSPSPPPPAGPRIDVTGQPQVVFDWTTDRCDDEDIPDIHARVFRDSQGRLQLLASHHVTRRMIGPDLDQLSRECRPVMTSHRSPRPEAYDSSEWISAPYTLDGQTVYALVHNEYHGQDHGQEWCPSGSNAGCWYDALTLAASTSAGDAYGHTQAPSHLVASVPFRYVPDQAGLGYYGGTNIVRNPADGYFYAFIGQDVPGWPGGACFMRTQTLDRADSWRAWDGTGFNHRFRNPYLEPIPDPIAYRCSPIIDGLAESLSWNTYFERWLLIGSRTAGGSKGMFFFSTSTDLVNWTEPREFLRLELVFTHSCGEEDPKAYASFIDPSSSARNFDVSGKTGWLYYTQFHYRGCQMTLDRDLVRRPIELTN